MRTSFIKISNKFNSRLTNIYANGCIDFYMWRDNGIRPIVCLNSNVKLKEVTGGFEIE